MALPTTKTTVRDSEGIAGTGQHNLGTLRLRHHETNEIILIPTPTSDPNDPLNWSPAFRYFLAILVCLAVFFCNFLAAGPTVAIVAITEEFVGPEGPNFNSYVSKVSYFFSTTALCQGLAMLFWMPLIVKYGRRPIYVISFVLYLITGFWTAFAKTYNVELAGRIILGCSAGALECLGPLSIADTFFLHERGGVMSIYTAALSMGVAGGIILDGLITIHNGWRMIYYVATALIGAVTLLIVFAFPETSYDRSQAVVVDIDESGEKTDQEETKASGTTEDLAETGNGRPAARVPVKESYWSSLRLFHGTFTQESMFRLFIRPIILIVLPPVLWASLVWAVTVGFLVAITSNYATAFSDFYGMKSWQAGLCFIAPFIGSALAIGLGGHLSDWIADVLTRRNGGIREPEMRLPAIIIGGLCAPVALILYGVGIQNGLHWIVPVIGLGLLNFSLVQSTNIAMVYCIDSYRPATGEVSVSILAFKAAFGFLLSFYTNPWIDADGYAVAFGEMAAIAGIMVILVIPFYLWGKAIRYKTWQWSIMVKYGHWNVDREVGE